jgi:hypothetical protein
VDLVVHQLEWPGWPGWSWLAVLGGALASGAWLSRRLAAAGGAANLRRGIAAGVVAVLVATWIYFWIDDLGRAAIRVVLLLLPVTGVIVSCARHRLPGRRGRFVTSIRLGALALWAGWATLPAATAGYRVLVDGWSTRSLWMPGAVWLALAALAVVPRPFASGGRARVARSSLAGPGRAVWRWGRQIAAGSLLGLAPVAVLFILRADNGCTGVAYEQVILLSATVTFSLGPIAYATLAGEPPLEP